MSDDETLETQTATTGETVTKEPTASATAAAGTETGSTTAAATAATTVPQVVYVGPKLRTPYPVAPLTIFRGALPPPLATAVATDEDLAACFVQVADLGTAKIRLKNASTALARSVAAVATKYLQKKEA